MYPCTEVVALLSPKSQTLGTHLLLNPFRPIRSSAVDGPRPRRADHGDCRIAGLPCRGCTLISVAYNAPPSHHHLPSLVSKDVQSQSLHRSRRTWAKNAFGFCSQRKASHSNTSIDSNTAYPASVHTFTASLFLIFPTTTTSLKT